MTGCVKTGDLRPWSHKLRYEILETFDPGSDDII